MKTARLIALLVAAVLITAALGRAGIRLTPAVTRLGLLGFGIGQLILAGLLYRGILRPGLLGCWSPLGQLFFACAWLAMSALYLIQFFPFAYWPAALVPWVLIVIGLRLEHQVRARHQPS